jgi:hypothetical protein
MSSDYEAGGLHDAVVPIGLVVLQVLNCTYPFASRSSTSTRVVVEAMTAAMVQSPPPHTHAHTMGRLIPYIGIGRPSWRVQLVQAAKWRLRQGSSLICCTLSNECGSFD